MSNMRQPWNPGSTKADVSNLKIHPDKPIHPFSNTSSSKQQHTPIVSKSGSLRPKTKMSRNSPDPASTMSDRNASHAGQKGSAVVSRKRSIEKTFHSNSVPTKKKLRSYGRQFSRTSGPDSSQSDDQGYGSDIKLSQIAQTPIRAENGKHVSSMDAFSVDLTHKLFHPESSATDQQPTLALVHRKHPTDCNGFQTFEHATDSRHSTHVRFDVDDPTNGRDTQPQSSDSEAQQFSSLSPVSRDSDSVIDLDDEMEEDVTANSFQFAKQTEQNPNFVRAETGELGSQGGPAAPIPTARRKVIDIGLGQTSGEMTYKAQSLYIAETATWDIPKTTIPNDPQKLSEWENIGAEIASRAAQLIADYISHRRDRANLFDRVQKRVMEHKTYLKERGKSLTSKLTTVSLQCEVLIEEVKTGAV